MPYRRLIEWQAFEEEFGPLTLHKRLDWAVALLTYSQAISNGYRGKPSDFLPEWESPKAVAHIADWLSAVARKP
jgi:hypothetical protein